MPFAPGFPFTAFLIKAPYLLANGYSDSLVIVAVQVMSVIDGEACCGVRTGGTSAIEIHSVANMASTQEKALEKVAAHLSAMHSRPLLKIEAGKTESTAEPVSIPAPEPTPASVCPATGRTRKPAYRAPYADA